MLLKQHTVPSPISIIIKNTKNNYTQYSQLPKNKKINPMLLKQHTLKSIMCIIYL